MISEGDRIIPNLSSTDEYMTSGSGSLYARVPPKSKKTALMRLSGTAASKQDTEINVGTVLIRGGSIRARFLKMGRPLISRISMLADDSIVAWELEGEWSVEPPWHATTDAKEGGEKPWPPRILEDLHTDKSIIARDVSRIVFRERQSAEVWRERIGREGFSVAERWDLKQVRLVKKGSALAEAIDGAGLSLKSCEGFYAVESDFFEHILPLELILALRTRMDTLERSPR